MGKVKRFIAGEGVYSKKSDEGVVLFKQGEGFVRELNEVAGLIWKMIEKGPVSVERVVRQLGKMYEVDERRAKEDVVRFVQKYLKEGLVEEVS